MPSLAQYIQDMQTRGYSLPQIKQYLSQYGYSEEVIDHTLYGMQEKPHHFNFLIIIVLILALAGAGMGYFLIQPQTHIPAELLDVSLSEPNAVKAGEFVQSQVSLINMGKKERYDVYLKYEVFDSTNNRVTFKSETVALEDTKQVQAQIQIPQGTQAGSYTLQATARYQGTIATAQMPFTIEEEEIVESCSDGILNQDEEDIDCGGVCQACRSCPEVCEDDNPLTIARCDASTGFECQFNALAACGNNKCEEAETEYNCPKDCKEKKEESPDTVSPWTVLSDISEDAAQNPEDSKQQCLTLRGDFRDSCLSRVGDAASDPNICDLIEATAKRDLCFLNVAKSQETSLLCANILSEEIRDRCYTFFLTKHKDYSVCEKLKNEHIRNGCFIQRETFQ